MRAEAILRDLDPLREARGHHPPADRALQCAEAEDQPEPAPQLRTYAGARQEIEERQQIDNADDASELPMAPFPPEDRLEVSQTHAGVELAILRDQLVAFERLLPFT